MDPVELFYQIDEFCKIYLKEAKKREIGKSKESKRKCAMTLSEIITVRLLFHTSGYKTVKDFFLKENAELKSYFPHLVSYSRFVEVCAELLLPFLVMAKVFCEIQKDEINYIDSTKLSVSHIRRASRHKTFAGIATKGCTSVGWFFGFKLHLVTNAFGAIVDFDITPGNVADNNASLIRRITKKLIGKLFGDRGYLLNSDLFAELFSRGLTLITKIRSNMKPRLMTFHDKIALQKRGLSETVIGILKGSLNLEHSRHRSPAAFFVHIASTLIAYFFRPNKPSVAFSTTLLHP